MTALQLLSFILPAIAVQLAAVLSLAFWRWRKQREEQKELLGAANAPSAPAWAGWRDFRVTRCEDEDRSHSQRSFYLAPADGAPLPTYVPGQFLTVAVPVVGAISAPGVGSGFVTRCYSLSDKPRTDAYRITVKRALAPAGAPNALPGVASSYFHDTVGEGQVLALKAPAGRFCLDPDPTVPTVLIAGGVGVTPMISMLTAANAERSERLFHLYYGVRNGADHAFRSTLENLIGGNRRLKLTVVYERPLPEDLPGRDFAYPGFIDLDLLRRTLPAGERHKFYVCGPPPMMASLIPALRGWGIPDADIAFEAFGPASFQAEQRRVPAVAESPLDVRFERSKRSLVWDGRDATLLDFAERQGIAVESGCRSGNCGSCETRIVSGAVRYLQPAAWEVAPDHCLLCVTEPTSALVLQA